jgi:hypothetical protein
LTSFIEYTTFNKICENEINKHGNLRDIVLNLVLSDPTQFTKAVKLNKDDPNQRPKILLIDEVDVFFSKDFFGNTYNTLASLKCPQVSALTDYIWSQR